MPVYIKLDVDGAEISILDSAPEVLAQPGMRWIIETHSPDLERRCLEQLAGAGYTTRVVPNAWWRIILPELRPSIQNRWLVATREPGLI